MIWQFNWKSWTIHWSKEKEDWEWDCYRHQHYSNFLVIGPLQMHWYSS